MRKATFINNPETLTEFLIARNLSGIWCGGYKLKPVSKTTLTRCKYVKYNEASQILGQTYEYLVLQDITQLTPNILCKLLETVSGYIFIIDDSEWPFNFDVSTKFKSVLCPKSPPRFSTRLAKLTKHCPRNVFPEDMDCSPNIQAVDPNTAHIRYTGFCANQDQADGLANCIDWISPNKSRILAITAPRGRGKSAMLGILVIQAIESGKYERIVITAPTYDNATTIFQFINSTAVQLKLDVQKKDKDFLKIFQPKAASVLFATPDNLALIETADLLLVDEAASIPLPRVEQLLKGSPKSIVITSTVQGYEGTGRSLALKLIAELKNKSKHFKHIQLNAPIRYKVDDPVEKWIYQAFCLEATTDSEITNAPLRTFFVNRDKLFDGSKRSERLLHQTVALFVTSHYKNSPDDLLMLADAETHDILVSMVDDHVVCAVQISFEGGIPPDSPDHKTFGYATHGDLIAWKLTEQFQEKSYAQKIGCRIVRIATNPDFQKKGYGSQTIRAIETWLQKPAANLTSNDILTSLEEISPRFNCDYFGTSFGLTSDLYRFWTNSAKMVPVFLSHFPNEITGEFSCIMIKSLTNWSVFDLLKEFGLRFMKLLPDCFRNLPSGLVANILDDIRVKIYVTPQQIDINPMAYQRLNSYCDRTANRSIVRDLWPDLARNYFMQNDVQLSALQATVLSSFGFQFQKGT